MRLTQQQKLEFKMELINCLKSEPEITKIIIFGSFVYSNDPHDIDIAIFQESNEKYLPLSQKYRKKLRPISKRTPIDVIPIRPDPQKNSLFLAEIEKGEIVYERGN